MNDGGKKRVEEEAEARGGGGNKKGDKGGNVTAHSAATGRLTSEGDINDPGGDNGGTQNGDPEMEKKMAKEVESGGVGQKKTIRSTKTR